MHSQSHYATGIEPNWLDPFNGLSAGCSPARMSRSRALGSYNTRRPNRTQGMRRSYVHLRNVHIFMPSTLAACLALSSDGIAVIGGTFLGVFLEKSLLLIAVFLLFGCPRRDHRAWVAAPGGPFTL